MTDEIKKLSEQEVIKLNKIYAGVLRGVPYPLERVLAVAEDVVKTGEHQYKALCPCHDDINPSLSISYDKSSEKVLLHCHACGSEKQYADFLTAWGLSREDVAMPVPDKCGIVAEYDYTDEQGNLLYQRVRFEPKRFFYRRPDSDKWLWNLDGVRRVLYNLPGLIEAKSPKVVFVEGEKDVDVLLEQGFIATTSGGATSWRSEFAEYFTGREVVIIPDRDKAGSKHANKVAHDLCKTAASIKMLRLRYGKDVADFFKLDGTAAMLRYDISWAKPVTDTTHAYAPTVTWLDEVELKEVRWLWQNRIPLGKLTLLAGEAGIGKSLLTLDIAARISTGTVWPDGRGTPDIGSVLICTSEDDTEDTVGVRLVAAGADLNKVAHVENVFGMDEIVDKATETLKDRPDIRLIILDPLTEFLGNADSHKNAEVRRALTPLISFASKHSIAILGVTHYSKAEKFSAANKIIGSIAFNAAARQVWHVIEDGSQRLFVAGKANLTGIRSGLAYMIENTTVNYKGKELTAVKVNIKPDPVCETAQDVLERQNHKPSKVEIGKDFLELQLAEGPKDQKKITELALQQGITEHTLRTAREELRIVKKQTGKGKTRKCMWSLP